jgi:hypothetical protein
VEGHTVRLDPDTPKAARVAGVLVGLQGLCGIVFAVVLMVQPGVLRATDRYGEAAFFVALGAGVIGFGAALVLGKRGARSPAVVIELVLLGIAGYATVPSSRPEYGLPVAALCLYTLYLLLSSGVRDWVMDLQKDPD